MFTLFCVLLLIFNVFIIGVWFIDRTQTCESSTVQSYGTYKDFLNQMGKIEWERDKNHPRSFFPKSLSHTDWYVHAGVFIFNGTGMLFNIFDWILVVLYLEKHKLSHPRIKKTEWK